MSRINLSKMMSFKSECSTKKVNVNISLCQIHYLMFLGEYFGHRNVTKGRVEKIKQLWL